MNKMRFSQWAADNKAIALLLLLIFAERVYVLCTLGADYNLANDDMVYIASAFRFLDTGGLVNEFDLPTAISMPGMTWLIALFLTVFGEELAFWVAIKLFWILMGTATAYVTYKAVTLMAPKWCGLIAAGCYLAPNIAWMDNILLTETPYFLCFTLTIYLTLLMGKTDSKKVFAVYCVAFLAGFLLRPTIVVMPVFSLGYLFLLKVDRKLLWKRMWIGIAVLMVFLGPWIVRNYIHFEHFVPMTSGSGNPMREGTYQGFGYPSDEELDYETNVDDVWREKFAEYFDEDGELIRPEMHQYLDDQKVGMLAKYRMSVWWEENPLSMALSYLLIKPGIMLVKTFYWQEVLGTPAIVLDLLRGVNFFLCCGAVLLCFVKKRFRMEVGFLTLVYWFYIYAISVTYSFSRYGETLMSLRYIIMAVGFMLMLEWWKERKQNKKPAP